HRIDADAFGPIELVFAADSDRLQRIEVAEPADQWTPSHRFRCKALIVKRQIRRTKQGEESERNIELPSTIAIPTIDRETELHSIDAGGRGFHEIMSRLTGLPGHPQSVGKAARMGYEIEHGAPWSKIAKAAMQQSTGTGGRAGAKIPFVDDQGAISGGGEVLSGAGAVDSATDDGNVERGIPDG